MEKFGLFDLLAALAADRETAKKKPAAEKGAPPAAEERGARPPERETAQGAQGVFTAEERRRRAKRRFCGTRRSPAASTGESGKNGAARGGAVTVENYLLENCGARRAFFSRTSCVLCCAGRA